MTLGIERELPALEFLGGVAIETAIRLTVQRARELGGPVLITFNDWHYPVWPTDDERNMKALFDRHCEVTGIAEAMRGIFVELERARASHGPMKSAHEGYAVILEELDELWTEIKKRDPDPEALRDEATQVGAMAARFLLDVCK